MIEIPLVNSELVAKIDYHCYPLVKDWKWYVADRRWVTYAMGYQTGAFILMHQLILPTGEGKIIDHIDRDGLNNQLENLRRVTPSESSQNTKKRSDAVASQFKGVGFNSSRWRARIKKEGQLYHIGYFDTEIEAALAYDTKALELYGPHAATNFKAEIGIGPDWGSCK